MHIAFRMGFEVDQQGVRRNDGGIDMIIQCYSFS